MNAPLNAIVVILLASAPHIRAEEPARPVTPFKALWEEHRASGILRTNYFQSSKTLDDTSGLRGAALHLKALPEVNDRISGKLEVRASNSAIGSGGASRVEIIEAFARIRFARADLQIGKQIVAWGRADGINPTDNLTSRDYTVMLPFEEDQRFGTPAAKLDVYLTQELALTVFASPFFEAARVPLPSRGFSVREKKPAQTVSNTSAGVKLNKTGEGVDWSVSYYRGYSLTPTAQVSSPPTSVGDVRLELHHDRISVLGADIARNYGRFGFRAELAWFDTSDDAGINPAIRNAHLFWIAGVDRTFGDRLNVNLQFFQRRFRNHRAPDTFTDGLARSTAELNAIFNAERDPVGNGISFRVSNQWLNDTLEAEVFAAIDISRDSSFMRPLITYAFTDHWQGTLGADLYFGDSSTQYGSLKPNRGAFAELRYGF